MRIVRLLPFSLGSTSPPYRFCVIIAPRFSRKTRSRNRGFLFFPLCVSHSIKEGNASWTRTFPGLIIVCIIINPFFLRIYGKRTRGKFITLVAMGRRFPTMSADSDNHYLSLVIPALKKYAQKLIIRPFVDGSQLWGEVTFQEWDRRLAAARLHWRRTLTDMTLQPGDVIGLW